MFRKIDQGNARRYVCEAGETLDGQDKSIMNCDKARSKAIKKCGRLNWNQVSRGDKTMEWNEMARLLHGHGTGINVWV